MSGCTFGIILNIITILLIFTIVYVFYGIYYKSVKNTTGETVNATQVLKSVIQGNLRIKDVSNLDSIPSYNWFENEKPYEHGMLDVRTYPIT